MKVQAETREVLWRNRAISGVVSGRSGLEVLRASLNGFIDRAIAEGRPINLAYVVECEKRGQELIYAGWESAVLSLAPL